MTTARHKHSSSAVLRLFMCLCIDDSNVFLSVFLVDFFINILRRSGTAESGAVILFLHPTRHRRPTYAPLESSEGIGQACSFQESTQPTSNTSAAGHTRLTNDEMSTNMDYDPMQEASAATTSQPLVQCAACGKVRPSSCWHHCCVWLMLTWNLHRHHRNPSTRSRRRAAVMCGAGSAPSSARPSTPAARVGAS